jgi:Coenzyme PQQ synthesis protein D (PqqD)
VAFAEQHSAKKIVTRSPKRAPKGKHSVDIELAIVADLSNLKILHDRFVFDVISGTFHRVSETAAFILDELKLKIPIAELVTHYSDRYRISRAVAERDVELFLNDLSLARLPVYGAVGAEKRDQES